MASKLSDSSLNQLKIELMNAGKKLLHLPSLTADLLNVLTQVDQILSRVAQSPSDPMYNAMHPIIEALIAKELVRHPELDVNISVASCIFEILRIMAPDPLYNDQQLKEIFELVVMTFEKLSSASGGCYTKMTKVLEIFNRVRLITVMLDLEMDELVVRLFKQFLTFADFNSTAIVLEMEAIMTSVIEDNEESEELTQAIVDLIVTSVKKDNQVASPVCRQLGRQVIKNCDAVLKERLPDKVAKELFDSLRETISSTTDDTSKMNNDATNKRKLECLEGSRNMGPLVEKKQLVIPTPPIHVSSLQSGIICVQGYKVNENFASILESIFKKHGDIAAKCVFKADSLKTYFLEVLCEIARKIQNNDATNIISNMEEIECQVSDAEAANIDVLWLRAHLEAVYKRNEAMKESSLLMETKANTILVKRAAQMDLRERSAELVVAQQRFETAEKCVESITSC